MYVFMYFVSNDKIKLLELKWIERNDKTPRVCYGGISDMRTYQIYVMYIGCSEQTGECLCPDSDIKSEPVLGNSHLGTLKNLRGCPLVN